MPKEKIYVNVYNKNKYQKIKDMVKVIDNDDKITKIPKYCKFCHYHTDIPYNMKIHFTSNKHFKNMMDKLTKQTCKVKDGEAFISFIKENGN